MQNGNESRVSDRRVDWLCLLFLLAVNTFYYRRILFLGEIPEGNDLQYQYFAWKNFFISSLKEGIFPFWNPYIFSGSPVIHEILAACFYPFDYLFLILPIPWGFGLSYWFHLTLGGFLFYWLAGQFIDLKPARLLAATAYMLSAPVLTRMGEGVPTMNQTYALTPLFFVVGKFLYENPSLRWLGCFSWVCALFVYAGHPQIPFMAVQLLAAYLLYRTVADYRGGRPSGEFLRAYLFLLLGGFLGLAIAAPQAFPFLEYASFSATRAGGAKYMFAAEGSLPPTHLITSVIPFLFGDPSDKSYWRSLIPFHETCGYLGAFCFFFTLAWLVLSKRKGTWIWFTIVVATIFLAMGHYTPVHRFFYEAVPGWDRFRQPARSFFILAFAGSLLAGYGFQRLGQLAEEEDRGGGRRIFMLLGVLLLLVTAGVFYTALHKQDILQGFSDDMNRGWRLGTGQEEDRYSPENFLHRYTNLLASLSMFAVWIILFLGWFFSLLKFPEHRRWILWAAPVVLAIVLLLFGSRFLETHAKEGWEERYYPDSELMALLQEQTDEGRLIIPDNALHWGMREREPELYPNGPLYYRVRVVRGYNPTILLHYSQFINVIQGRDPDTFPGGLLFLNDIPNADTMGLRVLGVKHLVEWNQVGAPFVPEKKFSNGLLLYRFDQGLPRVFRAREADNDWGLEPIE
ncbi:MAG: hypothetical protein KC978_03865, partial [Candidatus Omnitrophica bacterium]|nr:hypothetical protein [Candidatus Omnitrophota bacterium]